MPIFLIKTRDPLEPPRIMFGKDAHDAILNAGLTPAIAIARDITRRTLQPHHIDNTPLTADFLSTPDRAKHSNNNASPLRSQQEDSHE